MKRRLGSPFLQHPSPRPSMETKKDFTTTLPTELCLKIFSNLDYFTLKACQCVSKAFKALTEDHTLNAALFRHGAPVSLDWTKPSAIHPALKVLRFHHGPETRLHAELTDLRMIGSSGRKYKFSTIVLSSPVTIPARRFHEVAVSFKPMHKVSTLTFEHCWKNPRVDRYGETLRSVLVCFAAMAKHEMSRFFPDMRSSYWRVVENDFRVVFEYQGH